MTFHGARSLWMILVAARGSREPSHHSAPSGTAKFSIDAARLDTKSPARNRISAESRAPGMKARQSPSIYVRISVLCRRYRGLWVRHGIHDLRGAGVARGRPVSTCRQVGEPYLRPGPRRPRCCHRLAGFPPLAQWCQCRLPLAIGGVARWACARLSLPQARRAKLRLLVDSVHRAVQVTLMRRVGECVGRTLSALDRPTGRHERRQTIRHLHIACSRAVGDSSSDRWPADMVT